MFAPLFVTLRLNGLAPACPTLSVASLLVLQMPAQVLWFLVALLIPRFSLHPIFSYTYPWAWKPDLLNFHPKVFQQMFYRGRRCRRPHFSWCPILVVVHGAPPTEGVSKGSCTVLFHANASFERYECFLSLDEL